MDLDQFCRNQFINMDWTALNWQWHEGKPGYSEVVLDVDHDAMRHLQALSTFIASEHEISLSIRKYPRRYYVAVMLSPDPEADALTYEYTQDGDGDGIIGPAMPTVSVIMLRVEHALFDANRRAYLGELFDTLANADFDAIYLHCWASSLKGAGTSHGA